MANKEMRDLMDTMKNVKKLNEIRFFSDNNMTREKLVTNIAKTVFKDNMDHIAMTLFREDGDSLNDEAANRAAHAMYGTESYGFNEQTRKEVRWKMINGFADVINSIIDEYGTEQNLKDKR